MFGPLVPHDILRVSGIEAVQDYMVREVQAVYRSQRVDIDDKHIEIIVSQMLRKVKVTNTGDTGHAAGRGHGQVRVPGGQPPPDRGVREGGGPGRLAARSPAGSSAARRSTRSWRTRSRWAGGRRSRRWRRRSPADNEVQLLGITKAAVQSDSFISAASFQETTKVLTEAALASKVDYLVGPEGERHPGAPDPGRDRVQDAPGVRGEDQHAPGVPAARGRDRPRGRRRVMPRPPLAASRLSAQG